MYSVEKFEKAVKDCGYKLTRVVLWKDKNGQNVVRCGFYEDDEKGINIMWNCEGFAYIKRKPTGMFEEDYYFDKFYGHEIAFPRKEVYWRACKYDLYFAAQSIYR
jgi:hypothetical protein